MAKQTLKQKNFKLTAARLVLFALSATLGIQAPASPPQQTPALGIILGEPTGISGKYFFNGHEAVDVALAFSLSDFFLLHADYLYHFTNAFGRKSTVAAQIQPYLGVGGVLFISTRSTRTEKKFFADSTSSSVGLGIRVPLGLEWSPVHSRLGVFAELAPGIGIVPSTFGFLQGGIGIRYYF